MRDYHLPEYLLVFQAGVAFYDHKLYIGGEIVLQDKASCFTVAALNPPPGSVILDACSAPGNKTCQAAAYSKSGKVIAVERDKKRCKILRKLLAKHGASSMTEVLNKDFLHLDPEEFAHVNYIILDPTCSGSGCLDNRKQQDKESIQKLANLQCMLLRHAMKFPNVKNIAYSTCSVNEEENEAVVKEALQDSSKFKLAKKSNVLPKWDHHRGLNSQKSMIRVDPEIDLCTGFFVAVLERN